MDKGQGLCPGQGKSCSMTPSFDGWDGAKVQQSQGRTIIHKDFLPFFNSFFFCVHNFKLQGIVRLMQRARGCPSPDSPHINVLLQWLFLLSVWVCVFVLSSLSVVNTLWIRCPFTPKLFSLCLLKNKDIIKIRKIILIQLVYRSHSDFTSCPNNVLY